MCALSVCQQRAFKRLLLLSRLDTHSLLFFFPSLGKEETKQWLVFSKGGSEPFADRSG